MKINSLTATFGKFNNDSISFHSGLNVIEAPNESGKTTWCAFIKDMLYGVDSGERQKAGYLPDKQKYAPWSGAPMEGTMELTAEGCDITLTRTTREKSSPMREFSAVYTGTATPVEGLTGTNAGQRLTGVSKDVFCRSAYVGQGTAAVTGSPELEKKIAAILSTGEEEISYSETDKRLKAWQRERRYNRTGTVPDADARINELERRLDDMHEGCTQVQALEEQVKALEEECAELEDRVTGARKKQRISVENELKTRRESFSRATAEQTEAYAEVTELRTQLKKNAFSGRTTDEVEAEAESDIARLEQLATPARGSVAQTILAGVFFILALAGVVTYTVFYSHIAVAAATLVFCALAVVMLVMASGIIRENKNRAAQTEALLKKYDADSVDGIYARLDEYHALSVALEKATERERKLSEECARTAQSLTHIERDALEKLDFTSGSSEAAELGRELNKKRAEIYSLQTEIARENGRLMALGDPLVLGSELKSVKAKRETAAAEYEAIKLAIDTLKEADTVMQTRFSPELGKAASRYMAEATDGKYSEIQLNRDFSAKIKEKDNAVSHESEFLSAGTADLMYLAVRFALCEIASPEGDSCPLIIDDALVNMDETRYAQVMKLLREIAKERQVIIFTCHKEAGNADRE